ncbi:fimbrial protein [Pseudomonas sp. TAE6080]|uniref:fimbrial protein n=1 Tax=Pseudomonas sp. TAE6080 TaxID=2840374 RepID=UPI001C003857|nr:fimbrial protein [Pseudomonas sp. TAE6080]MBT9300157.1 fimbrial protein [Pseudomonas sp. TAE6080]
MPLTKRFLPLLLWAGAVLPATSHALACVEDGTNSAITREALGTALAISADAPDGTIIWESGPRSVQILCKQDYEAGREGVYFYVNPAKANIGTGIRLGIRYNNQLITQSTGAVATGFFSDHGCNWANCQGWDKARFTLNFSVFIEKYGTTPPNGQASQLASYRVFQLDGKGGLNPRPNSNLNYVVTGMNDIRFVPCAPDLTISPSVVNFPNPSHKASIGEVASSANFSLNLRKGCYTPYTVSARFATTPGGGGVINGLLVPGNNKSVGISLSRVDSQQPLPFNDWFTLQALMGQGQSHNEFRADLKWRTQPIPGVFDAAVVVDMYYK